MTDHFDVWINGMSDDEYEEMLDDSNPFGFSDKQEEKALNIREPPTKEEQENLELEQEYNEDEDKRKETREKSKERFTISEGITELVQPTGEPITIKKTGDRVTMTRMPLSQPRNVPSLGAPPRVIPPSKPAIRSFRTSINNAVRSATSFVRRFFRV